MSQEFSALLDQLKGRRNQLRSERSQKEHDFKCTSAALDAAIWELDAVIDRLEEQPGGKPASAAPAQERRGRQPSGAVREGVLEKLDGDFGSMTAEDLATATGAKLPSVRAALKALDEKGLVTRSGDHWLLSNQEKARRQAARKAGGRVEAPTPPPTMELGQKEEAPAIAPVD